MIQFQMTKDNTCTHSSELLLKYLHQGSNRFYLLLIIRGAGLKKQKKILNNNEGLNFYFLFNFLLGRCNAQ